MAAELPGGGGGENDEVVPGENTMHLTVKERAAPQGAGPAQAAAGVGEHVLNALHAAKTALAGVLTSDPVTFGITKS